MLVADRRHKTHEEKMSILQRSLISENYLNLKVFQYYSSFRDKPSHVWNCTSDFGQGVQLCNSNVHVQLSKYSTVLIEILILIIQ